LSVLRKPLDAFASTTMLALCICWGFQQVAIKLVAADVAPIMQLGLRSGFAALVLGMLTLHREGRRAFADGTLAAGLAVGFLFGLEFFFIAEGLRYTTASHMVVFLYTAPIFTALGLHLRWPDERLSSAQWAGVLVAFVGIAITFLGRGGAADRNMLAGDALGVLAGAAWGGTTVGVRASALAEASPVKTLFYQLALAGLMLVPLAYVLNQDTIVPSAAALLSLGFQAIIVALASYLAWFWLLRRYLASRLSILSFMTPLFGVAFGVVILHEPIDLAFGVGAALVFAGLLCVSVTDTLRRQGLR
jgi:drug/metabolite transporter (DMT)-like permease